MQSILRHFKEVERRGVERVRPDVREEERDRAVSHSQRSEPSSIQYWAMLTIDDSMQHMDAVSLYQLVCNKSQIDSTCT